VDTHEEQTNAPGPYGDFGASIEEVDLLLLRHVTLPKGQGHQYYIGHPHGDEPWQQIGIVSEEPANVCTGTFTFDQVEELTITGWQTNSSKPDMKRLMDAATYQEGEETLGIYIPELTALIVALVQQLTHLTVAVTPLSIPSSLSSYCAATGIFVDRSYQLISVSSNDERKTLEQEVVAYLAEKEQSKGEETSQQEPEE